MSGECFGGTRRGGALMVVVVLLGVLAVIGAAVFFVGNRQGWFAARANVNLLTATVIRAPLDLKVVERGNLESAANVILACDVEGSTAIIKIVEEGTRAKKGQLLVELDSSTLRNNYSQQQILLKTAETALEQALKGVEIQSNQNESDIAAAKLKLDLAQLDLTKYMDGEYKQQMNTIEGEIVLAEEDVTRAGDQYNFTKRLSKKGYATSASVESDRIALTKAQIGLNVANEKKLVLEKFDFQRQKAEKEANAAETKRELTRVEQKAAAATAQAKADVAKNKLAAEVERVKLERLKQQIDACTIYAPQDGLVVYANERNNRGGGSAEGTIQERAQVRQRQPIINLPDVSKMRVSARIHESKIDLIEEGLPARIRVDALPGKVFDGKVTTVSLVPLSGNWPNTNLKEYATAVGIDSGPDGGALKPGLTAEVEILVERLGNVLQLPIQCVIERGGRHFAFVLVGDKPARRELVIGRSNEVVVEIKDGLNEGDVVVQNPRGGLAAMIADLEREVPADAPKPTPAADAEKSKTDPAKTPASKPVVDPKAGASASPAVGETLTVEERAKRNAERRKKNEAAASSTPAAGAAFNPAAMFAALIPNNDKDKDGKLSEAELPEPMRKGFADMDKNGDKFIDAAEVQKALEAFQERMKARAAAGSGNPAPGAAAP